MKSWKPVVTEMVDDMRHDLAQNLVAAAIPAHAYAEQWDIASLKTEVQNLMGLDLPFEDWAKEEGIADEEILERIIKASDEKIAEKRKRAGEHFFNHIEKSFVLRLLDQQWKEHLLHLDHLRQGINLRAFAQRDPLNEYKSEAFNMFEAMMGRLKTTIVTQLSLVEINIDEQTYEKMLEQQRAKEEEKARATRTDPAWKIIMPDTLKTPYNSARDLIPKTRPHGKAMFRAMRFVHAGRVKNSNIVTERSNSRCPPARKPYISRTIKPRTSELKRLIFSSLFMKMGHGSHRQFHILRKIHLQPRLS